MKRLISLTLALTFLLTSVFMISILPVNGEQISDRFSSVNIDFANRVSYGPPIMDVYTDVSVTSKMSDGRNIICGTIEGVDSVTYIYDLDNNAIINNVKVPNTHYSHAISVSPTGDIYIATQAHSQLIRFNVGVTTENPNGSFEILGDLWSDIQPSEPQHASYGVSFDDTGENVFIGTYPSASVIKYNVASKTFSDYGKMFEGDSQKYVRATLFHNGFIYAGGYAEDTQLVKLNVATGEKQLMQRPSYPGVVDEGEVKLFWFMDKMVVPGVGNFMIAYISKISGGGYYIVYDLDNDAWCDAFVAGSGYQLPRQVDTTTYPGKAVTYYVKSYTSEPTKRVTAYDFKTKTHIDTGIEYEPNGQNDGFRGASLVTLADQVKYPGKSIVTVIYSPGIPSIINLQTKKVEFVPYTPFESYAREIQVRAIGSGANDLVGFGGYKARKAGVLDTKTDELSYFPMEQVEGISGINGKIYYGVYAGAILYEYDPLSPTVRDENPKRLFKVGSEQDRIFNIVGADGKIVLSSTPITTALGGAVTVYDPVTKIKNVYKPVTDQAITATIYKDGFLYGTSHVWGGLGMTPTQNAARIFKMNIATGEVVLNKEIKTPEGATSFHAGGLTFDETGKLWVAFNGSSIMSFNPETLEVEKYKEIFKKTIDISDPRYQPYEMYTLRNGLILCTLTGAMYAIDVMDPAIPFQKITGGVYNSTIAENGNIYYSDSRNMYKIPVIYNDTTPTAPITSLSLNTFDKSISGSFIKPSDVDYDGCIVNLFEGQTKIATQKLDKKTTNFSFDNLKNAVEYNVEVVAIDQYTNLSQAVLQSVTVNDLVPPKQIARLSALVRNASVYLYWYNPDNLDFNGTEVSIYAKDGPQIETASLDKNTKAKVFYSLQLGATYTVKIKTKDDCNNIGEPVLRDFTLPTLEQVNSNVLYNEDYEGHEIGYIPTDFLYVMPNDVALSENYDTNLKVVSDIENPNNKVLENSCDVKSTGYEMASYNYLMKKNSSENTGNITLETKFKVSDTNASNYLRFYNDNSIYTASMIGHIGINNGKFSYSVYKGDSGDIQSVTPVANQWYNFKILINTASGTMKWYIDDTLVADINLVGNITLANMKLGAVAIATTGKTAPAIAKTWIDDFNITKHQEANIPPQIIKEIPKKSLIKDKEVTFDLTNLFFDWEGQAITLSTSDGAIANETLTFTPTAVGDKDIIITATDAGGAKTNYTIKTTIASEVLPPKDVQVTFLNSAEEKYNLSFNLQNVQATLEVKSGTTVKHSVDITGLDSLDITNYINAPYGEYTLVLTASHNGNTAQTTVIINSLYGGVQDGKNIISNYRQLDNIRQNPTQDFLIVNNITADVGANFTPIPEFRGTIDGLNNSININISKTGVEMVGIVAKLYGAMQNMKFQGTVLGGLNTGAFAGRIETTGQITNCENNGSISSNNKQVGGIGGLSYGEITGCVNNGTVTGTGYIGGIAGSNYGKIFKSANHSNISKQATYVAGISADNAGNSIVNECYNSGNITGGTGVGGIMGRAYGSSDYTHDFKYNYNIGEITGTASVGGLIGALAHSTRVINVNINYCYDMQSKSISLIGSKENASSVINCSNSYFYDDKITDTGTFTIGEKKGRAFLTTVPPNYETTIWQVGINPDYPFVELISNSHKTKYTGATAPVLQTPVITSIGEDDALLSYSGDNLAKKLKVTVKENGVKIKDELVDAIDGKCDLSHVIDSVGVYAVSVSAYDANDYQNSNQSNEFNFTRYASVIGVATEADKPNMPEEIQQKVVKNDYPIPPNATSEQIQALLPTEIAFKISAKSNGSNYILVPVKWQLNSNGQLSYSIK